MQASCAPPAEPAAIDLSRCRSLLGTYVAIAVRGAAPGAEPLVAIEAAFDAIVDVDRLMSFHRPDSELSRLNAGAAGDLVVLHRWTVEVLRFAQAVHEASDGLFDPGVGAMLVDRALLPRHAEASGAACAESSITAFEILDDRRVRLRRAACIDLGGVAKGYAVDKAIEALAAHGVTQASVNAGGDLRVLGDARPVHVRRPDNLALLQPLGTLGDGALATSAGYFCDPEGADGQARGALVDPRAGAPVDLQRSFTVIAPTCMAADALTKVLALAGRLPPECERLWDAQALVL